MTNHIYIHRARVYRVYNISEHSLKENLDNRSTFSDSEILDNVRFFPNCQKTASWKNTRLFPIRKRKIIRLFPFSERLLHYCLLQTFHFLEYDSSPFFPSHLNNWPGFLLSESHQNFLLQKLFVMLLFVLF